MNPTPNERRRCRHSGPPERAPIHGPGGAGNVEALRRRDGRMNRQGRSGVRRGRPHGGAAPWGNSTAAWAGASFSAHGEVADVRRSRRHRLRERPGRWCGGRAGPLKVADCGATAVKSVRCQGNEAKEGLLAVIIFRNLIVATLASRGLEEPAHASRGLEELFLRLCCCDSFLFWREIGFGFTYYLCT